MCKFGLVKQFLIITTVLFVLIFSSTSCKKNKLLTNSDAKVDFSSDSVLFDTVFTQAGSTTRQIRVINNHDQRINISSIDVQGGSSSPFFLNVDGSPGRSFTDIEIAAHDSVFIFIQVYINPLSSNSPLIVSDAIIFKVNGNEQKVQLEAWGQDAYYHRPNNALKFTGGGYLAYSTVADDPITKNPITNTVVTWPNDKPHVIYGWLVVDSSQTLVINAGVKVHFHQNAGLWVYRYGCLKVNGALGNEVVFQGDRLEPYMQDEPGQWDRIWINEGSKNNVINYAIIKNGFIGVQAEILLNINDPHHLKITNTQIRNMKKWGMYAVAFDIWGGNNVISNCKEYCLALVAGGNYTFLHSTFANFWTKDNRATPAVHIDNHVGTQQLVLDSCYFGNCIIDGNTGNELELDIASTSTLAANYKFSYCFLRTTASTTDPAHFVPGSNRVNAQTSFVNPGFYQFDLNGDSGAKDMGSGASSDASMLPLDIKGNTRPSGTPDAGAYEYP
jgi:hypothetical protein